MLQNFHKFVSNHILHMYSNEMSQKSEVYVLDILMKNEAKHKDMIDIMNTLQSYLGDAAEYDEEGGFCQEVIRSHVNGKLEHSDISCVGTH